MYRIQLQKRFFKKESHIEGDGEIIFRHACKPGLEGIVSKRKGLLYRFGTRLG